MVTEYFDGTLSSEQRSLFEEHVMSCPPCREYLAEMRETIRLLGRLPDESVSAEAEETLVAAFRGWQRD